MKLQIDFFYLKDMFGKLNKGKSDLNHLLNVQKHTTDKTGLWHLRIAHINMHHLNHLVRKDLVIGLPKLKFEKDKLCEACTKRKQVVSKQKRCFYFKTP